MIVVDANWEKVGVCIHSITDGEATEDKLSIPSDIDEEWQQFLMKNCDPGDYDAYRCGNDDVWCVDVYMPPYLVAKLLALGLAEVKNVG